MKPELPDSPTPSPQKPHTGVTRYDPEFAVLICERIATTPRSLVKICQAPDMPGIATIFRWVRDHPEFKEMYVIAKETQAEILIEEALDIVDDDSQDILESADGKIVFNRVRIQRCKMQVEHRRWTAAKLLPRKYGAGRQNSKSTAAHHHESAPAPILTPERMAAIQAQRREALEREEAAELATPTSPPPPAASPSPHPDLRTPNSDPQPSAASSTPHSDLASTNPDLRTPSPEPWFPPPPLTRPPSGHNPKRWYDVPAPPRRPKTTLNKACS